MVWPLHIEKNKRFLPDKGPGSFWEDRGDRFHCGIDLYASQDTQVCSIDAGMVIDVGVFTDPSLCQYWHTTYYVLIAYTDTLLVKYAEMGKVSVEKGDLVQSGEVIGGVGLVLNTKKITTQDPEYIQSLSTVNPSMLHFEVYEKKALLHHEKYLGGNWFGKDKPYSLKNPYPLLKSLNK